MYKYTIEVYCLYIAENNLVILRFFCRVDKVTEEMWEIPEARELQCVTVLFLIFFAYLFPHRGFFDAINDSDTKFYCYFPLLNPG